MDTCCTPSVEWWNNIGNVALLISDFLGANDQKMQGYSDVVEMSRGIASVNLW